MPRGRYICVDGVDGSGKSSLVRNICDYRTAAKKPSPAMISFPSSGPVGSLIREYLYGDREIRSYQALLYLFAADGEEQGRWMSEQIARGAVLLADRHPLLPALAYQTEYHPKERIEAVIDMARTVVPDLLLIIDVSVEVAMERMRRRPRREDVIFERVDRLRLSRVRERYFEVAETARARGYARRAVVIDGVQSEENILQAALEAAEMA